jgi:hypothetical protein
MAMEINDQNFEPSTTAKWFWLYVRKPGFAIEGEPFPGLFEITKYAKDKYTFYLALALEVWSMFMILSVGSIPVLYQVALVVTAIFVDVALAIYFHVYAGWILLRKNESIAATVTLAPGPAKAAQAKCASDIRLYKILRLIPATLILAFAICKCVVYIVLQREANILTVSVVVAYILVAIIHLNNTGYWFFACLGNFFLWLDRRIFQDIQNPKKTRVTAVCHKYEYITTGSSGPSLVSVRFPYSAEQYPPDGSIGLHHGVLPKQPTDGDASKPAPNYTLFTWGVFADQQLQAIANAQTIKGAPLLVASHGVKHQLDILVQQPAVPQGNPHK